MSHQLTSRALGTIVCFLHMACGGEPMASGSGGAGSAAGGASSSGGAVGTGGVPTGSGSANGLGTGGATAGGSGSESGGAPATGGAPVGTGGNAACEPPDSRGQCATLDLAAPPAVTLRFADDPWDDTAMSGSMAPGTYFLTDLIQNDQETGCARTVSAVLLFGADGKMSYRWDEAGVSSTFTADYAAGPQAGTVTYTIDCPESLAGYASGIAFQETETGFTMTYSDGLVHVFTRQ